MTKVSIFANIKQNLNISGEFATSERREKVIARINSDPRHTVPSRAIGSDKELVEEFIKRATLAGAQIIESESMFKVPELVDNWLDLRQLNTIKCATTETINALKWKNENRERTFGTANIKDKTCLTDAYAAIAETGTIVVISSPETPTLQAFLPDYHLVIVKRSQIVGSYEKTLYKLRKEFKESLPRNVNFITGPSRSADIEQTLLMGAHGPKELILFLVNE